MSKQKRKVGPKRPQRPKSQPEPTAGPPVVVQPMSSELIERALSGGREPGLRALRLVAERTAEIVRLLGEDRDADEDGRVVFVVELSDDLISFANKLNRDERRYEDLVVEATRQRSTRKVPSALFLPSVHVRNAIGEQDPLYRILVDEPPEGFTPVFAMAPDELAVAFINNAGQLWLEGSDGDEGGERWTPPAPSLQSEGSTQASAGNPLARIGRQAKGGHRG